MKTLEIENYLKDLFTHIEPYQTSEDDKKQFSRDKIEYIFRKLDRKKFRRKQMGEEAKKNLRNKIKISLDEGKPIHLVIPFGGYKHYWNPSHPEPDWAELFHFRYVTDYVLPVLALYEPGVFIEYISEDLILPRMNNYPDETIETYISKFREILTWYKQFVPKNLNLDFFRVSERCDKDKIIKEVEDLLPERRIAFDKLSDVEKEQQLHRSYRSLYWNGKKDLTKLTEEEKQNRIIESRLIELAYYDTESKPEYLGNYLGENDHICICFSFGKSIDNAFDDLTLGSSYGSIVDYWIGRGLLENPDKPHPRIISAKQYEQVKDKSEIINVNIGLKGKNYSTVEVIPNIN